MSTASADPMDFREAIEWFGTKVPMTRDTWNQLAADARKRAFTVAHVAHAELVRGIHDSLSRAIAQGLSIEEWADAAEPEIASAWGSEGTTPWHLETIFRTNVQSAYGAGRYAQLTDPDMLKLRPYWMFDAIRDSRTTPECKELNGTVMPADDPWWSGRIPPLHYNCRSSIRSLRQSEAEKQAKFNEAAPEHKGMKGFGGVPMVKESELDVDLTKYLRRRRALRSDQLPRRRRLRGRRDLQRLARSRCAGRGHRGGARGERGLTHRHGRRRDSYGARRGDDDS